MYDGPHWRSRIARKWPTWAGVNRTLVGLWPGAPDYSALPPRLEARTDPVPPMRNPTTFYPYEYPAEALTLSNDVVEDVGSDPDHPVMASVLDTLYYIVGGNSAPAQPVMTYYHGREVGPVVFSGFPLWYFQRSQAMQLGDFVLQRIWGIPRAALPR